MFNNLQFNIHFRNTKAGDPCARWTLAHLANSEGVTIEINKFVQKARQGYIKDEDKSILDSLPEVITPDNVIANLQPLKKLGALPGAQIFSTGARVNNDTIDWATWTGCVFVDVDSKEYLKSPSASHKELFGSTWDYIVSAIEMSLHNAPNALAMQVSASGTSLHFIFYFNDLQKNQEEFSRACAFSQECVRRLMTRAVPEVISFKKDDTGKKKFSKQQVTEMMEEVTQTPGVFDPASSKPCQPFYITPTPFKIVDCDGNTEKYRRWDEANPHKFNKETVNAAGLAVIGDTTIGAATITNLPDKTGHDWCVCLAGALGAVFGDNAQQIFERDWLEPISQRRSSKRSEIISEMKSLFTGDARKRANGSEIKVRRDFMEMVARSYNLAVVEKGNLKADELATASFIVSSAKAMPSFSVSERLPEGEYISDRLGAIQEALSRTNVYLNAACGTGKSYLVKKLFKTTRRCIVVTPLKSVLKSVYIADLRKEGFDDYTVVDSASARVYQSGGQAEKKTELQDKKSEGEAAADAKPKGLSSHNIGLGDGEVVFMSPEEVAREVAREEARHARERQQELDSLTDPSALFGFGEASPAEPQPQPQPQALPQGLPDRFLCGWEQIAALSDLIEKAGDYTILIDESHLLIEHSFRDADKSSRSSVLRLCTRLRRGVMMLTGTPLGEHNFFVGQNGATGYIGFNYYKGFKNISYEVVSYDPQTLKGDKKPNDAIYLKKLIEREGGKAAAAGEGRLCVYTNANFAKLQGWLADGDWLFYRNNTGSIPEPRIDAEMKELNETHILKKSNIMMTSYFSVGCEVKHDPLAPDTLIRQITVIIDASRPAVRGGRASGVSDAVVTQVLNRFRDAVAARVIIYLGATVKSDSNYIQRAVTAFSMKGAIHKKIKELAKNGDSADKTAQRIARLQAQLTQNIFIKPHTHQKSVGSDTSADAFNLLLDAVLAQYHTHAIHSPEDVRRLFPLGFAGAASITCEDAIEALNRQDEEERLFYAKLGLKPYFSCGLPSKIYNPLYAISEMQGPARLKAVAGLCDVLNDEPLSQGLPGAGDDPWRPYRANLIKFACRDIAYSRRFIEELYKGGAYDASSMGVMVRLLMSRGHQTANTHVAKDLDDAIAALGSVCVNDAQRDRWGRAVEPLIDIAKEFHIYKEPDRIVAALAEKTGGYLPTSFSEDLWRQAQEAETAYFDKKKAVDDASEAKKAAIEAFERLGGAKYGDGEIEGDDEVRQARDDARGAVEAHDKAKADFKASAEVKLYNRIRPRVRGIYFVDYGMSVSAFKCALREWLDRWTPGAAKLYAAGQGLPEGFFREERAAGGRVNEKWWLKSDHDVRFKTKEDMYNYWKEKTGKDNSYKQFDKKLWHDMFDKIKES